MELKCTICEKLISSRHPWNPEVKDKNDTSFHQFKNTDAVMCEECYKKYQKLFKLHQEVK